MKKDTSAEIAQKYLDLIMALTPGQRICLGCEMFDTARALAEAGLAKDANPQNLTLRSRLFLRFYGRDYSVEEQKTILQTLEGFSND